jgi:hypothetical protein
MSSKLRFNTYANILFQIIFQIMNEWMMNRTFENQERLLLISRIVNFVQIFISISCREPVPLIKNPPLSDAGQGGGGHAYTLLQNSGSYHCSSKCLLGLGCLRKWPLELRESRNFIRKRV